MLICLLVKCLEFLIKNQNDYKNNNKTGNKKLYSILFYNSLVIFSLVLRFQY